MVQAVANNRRLTNLSMQQPHSYLFSERKRDLSALADANPGIHNTRPLVFGFIFVR